MVSAHIDAKVRGKYFAWHTLVGEAFLACAGKAEQPDCWLHVAKRSDIWPNLVIACASWAVRCLRWAKMRTQCTGSLT